ncbi:TraR/DksA family transcriptional regulator [Planctomicrobium piriforme]|uniref:DnaK suppressor protein n=1 Tax=Planctomicrobium piriforme TaxID=1576369 RepID=A0A1I3QB12_9PLAN|nr:TraR/DksA C4-type zinc finger protein [Planctomicrobium piriforme]SFJ30316.1 DnaK suppressor protein [Planctomicrobium piriforme]
MARKDALLRLHERLIEQRDDLRHKLSLPQTMQNDDVGGDSADLASHDVEKELESQLVSLESRELVRIEKAIEAIRNGTYGQCEHCGERIPVARLQALPHTSCCIECQRKFERRSSRTGEQVDWESAWEYQSRESDRDLTMRDIQFDAD